MTDRTCGQIGIAWALVFLTILPGCLKDPSALHYLGEENLEYYRETATQIDFSDVQQESPEQVIATQEPRTINTRSHDEIWELPISEAILIALQNNRVIRQNGTFMNQGNALFTNPDRLASVYDPAIQASGFLFGGRGVESALAAFDARWDTSMLWGRNSNFLNNIATPGAFGTAETANFSTGLLKSFGYGGQVALSHDVDYLGTNSAGAMFPSSYAGRLSAQYRQPLLAGSGTEFTRIAGPITQSFGGITGVTQGVVIARINQDITLADFEASVRNLVYDVENQYWDLYLAYLQYDTAVNARRSAQRTWRDLKEEVDIDERNLLPPDNDDIQKIAYQQPNGFGFNQTQGSRNIKAEEAQARDAYYQARAATERALSQIYSTETQLRRLLGLPVNDGKVIRPLGDPLIAEFVPNFYTSLAESLTNRVELRRQKWSIKSLDLQLIAARSLTRPRLDLVGSASVNGFGDDLLDEHTTDAISGAGLNNMYGNLTRGDSTGWGVGFEMSVPVGFRSAHAQVRNIELRLAKAREVLSVQEMEISHELARSIQTLAVTYQNTQTLHNRWIAAQEFVRIRSEEKNAGISNTDLLLRAINSQAQAESAYHTSLIEYNKALADFQFRKGTLLEYNSIYLAEDDWDPEAYQDALRRARERSSAIENPVLETEPAAFSTGPYNHTEVYFENRIEPASEDDPGAPVELQPVPSTPPPAPGTDVPEAAQRRSNNTSPEIGLSRSAEIARQKTLALRKTSDPRSSETAETTTSPIQTRSQPTDVRQASTSDAHNPVELLSVFLDVESEPAAPTQVTPSQAADQNSSKPAAQSVIPQRPLLQPLPQMYTASSLKNPTLRVKPVPQEKLNQTRRPLVRPPQVASTQPQAPVSQTAKPKPAPQTPTAAPTPEIAVAPKSPKPQSPTPASTKPQTPTAKQPTTQKPTAPPPPVLPPEAPVSKPPAPQERPVQKSPAPRRATEIELFE